MDVLRPALADHREGDPADSAQTVANVVRMEAMLRREQPGLRLRSVVRAGGEHNERFWRAEFPAALRPVVEMAPLARVPQRAPAEPPQARGAVQQQERRRRGRAAPAPRRKARAAIRAIAVS